MFWQVEPIPFYGWQRGDVTIVSVYGYGVGNTTAPKAQYINRAAAQFNNCNSNAAGVTGRRWVVSA